MKYRLQCLKWPLWLFIFSFIFVRPVLGQSTLDCDDYKNYNTTNVTFTPPSDNVLYLNEECMVELQLGTPEAEFSANVAMGNRDTRIDSLETTFNSLLGSRFAFEGEMLQGSGTSVVDIYFNASYRVDDGTGTNSFLNLTDTFCYNIILQDTLPPMVDSLSNYDGTVDLNGTSITLDCIDDVSLLTTLFFRDNCDMLIPVMDFVDDTTIVNGGDACIGGREIVRKWEIPADDMMNKLDQDSVAITIVVTQDMTGPSIMGLPDTLLFACDDTMSIPDSAAMSMMVMTTDCNGIDTIIYSESSNRDTMSTMPTCAMHNYDIVRKWVVTDDCGNTTMDSVIIQVRDTMAPTFTMPRDTTLNCGIDRTDLSITGNVTNLMDNCGDIATPVYQDRDTVACAGDTLIMRIWSIADICGNVSVDTQRIHLIDTIPPSFVMMMPDTVYQSCTAVVSANPPAYQDNCSPVDSIIVPAPIDIPVQGAGSEFTILRTWHLTDNCGNTDSVKQVIIVEDTKAPDIITQPQDTMISCADNDRADMIYAAWLGRYAGTVAQDSCAADSLLTWFVYDTLFNQDPILPAAVCGANNGVYRSQTVRFVVSDGVNPDTTEAVTFSVIDNIAPVFENCSTDTIHLMTNLDSLSCMAEYTLPAPIVTDDCGVNIDTFIIAPAAQAIVSNTPGSLDVPVNPVEFMFDLTTMAGAPPSYATQDVSLRIRLNGIDGEQMTEYFNIVVVDDGTVLGRTNLVALQCDSSSTTISLAADYFNALAIDGAINIRLEPNVPQDSTRFAVNDICPGATATAEMRYIGPSPMTNTVMTTYSINGGAAVEFPFTNNMPITFDEGNNEVIYTATDCAGNATTCKFIVSVRDTFAPIIVPPAFPDVLFVEGNICYQDSFRIELPLNVVDACGFGEVYTQSAPQTMEESMLTFSVDPNTQGFVADDKTFTFTNLAANALENVTLRVELQGNVESNNSAGLSEYFVIYGDNGHPFASTSSVQSRPQNYVRPGSCDSTSIFEFRIIKDTFNTWASDGIIEFTAIAKRDSMSTNPLSSINPCDTLLADRTDGISFMTASISYQQVTPSFSVSGATEIPLTTMEPPAIEPYVRLNVGDNFITYYVEDKAGNIGSYTDTVTLLDRIGPTAVCGGTTIFINPSGFVQDTITPMEIDAGSTDNCGIDSFLVWRDAAFTQPAIFTCEDYDGSNNVDTAYVYMQVFSDSVISTCQALVRLVPELPEPSFFVSECQGDSLFLYANPPEATGNDVYTYEWTGPNGFRSTDENPIVPIVNSAERSGSYTVTITGVVGCSATGVVEVLITEDPFEPMISVAETVCTNEAVVLSTTPAGSSSGNTTTYVWFEALDTGDEMLATTTTPMFTIPTTPSAGMHNYYVTIQRNNCPDIVSPTGSVDVVNTPVATVNAETITVCEGEEVTLGSFTAGVGITYTWTGPNGFTSTAQFPTVLTDVDMADAGVYELTVQNGTCESAPVTTVVNILPSPMRPTISAQNRVVCMGDTLRLRTNITDAASYHWSGPDFSERITTTPTLLVGDITADNAGQWSLYVTQNGCTSEVSQSLEIAVTTAPLLNISADPSTVCAGDDIQLFASPTINGATYFWTGPNGFTSASQNPIIRGVRVNAAGMYQCSITSTDGCVTSKEVEVTVNTGITITGVSNDGPSCLEGPTDIQLVAIVFPEDDGTYEYQWTGPNNFISTDSVATIPNATDANNGNYQVVVTNNEGCQSSVMTTTVDISNPPATPATPQLSPSTPLPFCSGDVITLTTTGYSGDNVIYNWMTPAGITSTTVPSLTITGAVSDNSGMYSVFVTVDNCDSNQSGALNLTINPVPVAIAFAAAEVCEGDVIKLEAEMVQNARYEWTGPGGFTSSVRNPIISPANPDIHTGTYSLIVSVNGCTSLPTSVNVEVTPQPATPVIVNGGAVCLEEDTPEITLAVTAVSATPGASYFWYDDNGNQLGLTSSLTFKIDDLTPYQDGGTYDFFVEAFKDGCNSERSIPTQVSINRTTDQVAFAGDDISVCEMQSVPLSAEMPAVGTGRWSIVEGTGLTITNPDMANTSLQGVVGGNTYRLRWTLSNGACEGYASDDVLIFVTTTEGADAGDDIADCEVTMASLDANLPPNAEGMWSQPIVQDQLGVVITDPNNPNTTVTNLVPGNRYEFTWTLLDTGCGSTSDEIIVLVASGSSFAGDDLTDCGDGDTVLNADPSPNDDGRWSSPDATIVFADISDPNTRVSNLKEGANTFYWMINQGACGDASRDTVVITYKQQPSANPDEIQVPYGGATEFDLTFNDIKPEGFFINIMSEPIHGVLEMIDRTSFEFTAEEGYIGLDEFTYELCAEACNCSTATVVLSIGTDGTVPCDAPSIITPNQDGVNDTFVIPCLSDGLKVIENQLLIFNQWGDEVFRTNNYQNDWQGTFDGEELPVGTYFYVLKFMDSTEQPKSGFLIIQR